MSTVLARSGRVELSRAEWKVLVRWEQGTLCWRTCGIKAALFAVAVAALVYAFERSLALAALGGAAGLVVAGTGIALMRAGKVSQLHAEQAEVDSVAVTPDGLELQRAGELARLDWTQNAHVHIIEGLWVVAIDGRRSYAPVPRSAFRDDAAFEAFGTAARKAIRARFPSPIRDD